MGCTGPSLQNSFSKLPWWSTCFPLPSEVGLKICSQLLSTFLCLAGSHTLPMVLLQNVLTFKSPPPKKKTTLLHIWALGQLKSRTKKGECIDSISYKGDVGEWGLDLPQAGGLPTNEPQNWAKLSNEQCCIGTVRNIKDCSAYVFSVWRRRFVYVYSRKVAALRGYPCINQRKNLQDTFWEHFSKWIITLFWLRTHQAIFWGSDFPCVSGSSLKKYPLIPFK